MSDTPWAAIAQAAGSVVSAFSQHSANEANKQLAQNQMDFQERMSDTSYQRQMADMKKAGLNPILAGHMGGASSPGGGFTPMQSVAPNLGQLANSAVAQHNIDKNVNKQINQQADKVKAETQLAKSQAHLADVTSATNVANIVQRGLGHAFDYVAGGIAGGVGSTLRPKPKPKFGGRSRFGK